VIYTVSSSVTGGREHALYRWLIPRLSLTTSRSEIQPAYYAGIQRVSVTAKGAEKCASNAG
jgi:hypothetical protein